MKLNSYEVFIPLVSDDEIVDKNHHPLKAGVVCVVYNVFASNQTEAKRLVKQFNKGVGAKIIGDLSVVQN